MSKELKSCPFCGGKAVFDIEPDEEFGDMYFVLTVKNAVVKHSHKYYETN